MPDFEFGQQRKLPYSLEAEQSVLGSIMIDPESFTRIAGKIIGIFIWPCRTCFSRAGRSIR